MDTNTGDRVFRFNILYALVAKDGRGLRLFGPYWKLAEEAFLQSIPGTAFPEVWFELPLAGDPWLDMHYLTSHEGLDTHAVLEPERCGGCPEAFRWLASQGPEARQISLSWDISSGVASTPAVQFLTGVPEPNLTCDFLRVVGRDDAIDDYLAFVARMPEGWFACYTGTFPGRRGHHLRVECIPTPDLQRAYTQDTSFLEAHLHQVGIRDLGDTVISRCRRLARTPFAIEFQFDIVPGGYAGDTLGVSLRFASPSSTTAWQPFDPHGAGGALMSEVESWGLADDRWQLLSDTCFAMRAERNGKATTLYCYPAFLKLRWRCGEPLDAKAYLLAGEM